MTRQDAIQFLLTQPYKLGKLLGFNKLTKLHNKWIISMLTSKKDKTLLAHRGSYKTTCVSIVLALIIILRPTKKILFLRKTDTDTKEIIRQVQNILQDEHTKYFVKLIYGIDLELTVCSATEINTNLSFDIKGTNQLTGVGLGGLHSGKHYDYIFTDDIVNLQDRVSRAERERTKIYYQELENIKNRGGRIYNTATPWHKDDCVSKLMPNIERYDCYSTGLISKEELETIRNKMTNSLFAANYELRHVASDDVIFTSPNTNGDINKVKNGTAHIDAAYNGKDLTAFTIANKIDDKFYVLGKCWRKHVDDCEEEILEIYDKLNGCKIYCETNADKGYLAKDLKKKKKKVVSYHETTNKYVKVTSQIKPVWNNIIFVEGTDEDYINMICDFNENVDHDDAPDSLASLIRVLNRKNIDDTYKPLWN